MRVLLVFCHPDPESFVGSIRRALTERLERDGHAVTVLDLYAENFDPKLDAAGWRAHRHDQPHPAPDLAAHIAALRDCEALALVFPTWWYGLPATLKGWFDRVWQPGVGFTLKDGAFQTNTLANVRRLAVITTCGSPGWFIGRVVGDPVRRQVMRGLKLQLARGARSRWQAIYAVDERAKPDLAKARGAAVNRIARFLR